MPQVNYCYRCGRRASSGLAGCWYCGAPTERHIRPPRRCPLCDEIIQAKAKKCPHCGEYLEKKEEERAVELHVREGVQRSGPAGPPRGGGLPPPQAQPGRGLGTPRRLALPASPGSTPPLVEGSGIGPGARHQPPPPPTDDTLEVEFVSGPDEDDDNPLPIVGETLPPEARATAGLPDRLQRQRLARAGQGAEGHAPAPALAPKAHPLLRMLGLGRRPAQTYTDVDAVNPEDRYRICAGCGTEMLASDAFCFHCGARHGEVFVFAEGERPLSNTFLYLLTVLLIGVFFAAPLFMPKIKPEWEQQVIWISAIGAPMLSAWAFLRKPNLVSRFLSLLLFLASLAALYVEFS